MSEFVDSLHEVFVTFGPIRAAKMFGGYGIYHDDLMFALVADDVLYLKVDEQSRAVFDEQGLEPFVYEKNGRKTQMSYCLAPESIFDDPDEARHWAIRAFDAALRARAAKPKRRGQ